MSGDVWKPVGREGELQYRALNPCSWHPCCAHKLPPVNLSTFPFLLKFLLLYCSFSTSQANSYVNNHFWPTLMRFFFCNSCVPGLPQSSSSTSHFSYSQNVNLEALAIFVLLNKRAREEKSAQALGSLLCAQRCGPAPACVGPGHARAGPCSPSRAVHRPELERAVHWRVIFAL